MLLTVLVALLLGAQTLPLQSAAPIGTDPLHSHCQALSAGLSTKTTGHERVEALKVCREAVEMARRFSPGAKLEARTTGLNDLVLLLTAPGKASTELPEASALAEEGIALVAGASPHVPAVAEAHITRAEVRSLAGDLRRAEADCSATEEVFTTLLADERERTGRRLSRADAGNAAAPRSGAVPRPSSCAGKAAARAGCGDVKEPPAKAFQWVQSLQLRLFRPMADMTSCRSFQASPF